MRRKLLSVAFGVVLMASMSTVTYAKDEPTKSTKEPVLQSTEVKQVEGSDIIINTYEDNGRTLFSYDTKSNTKLESLEKIESMNKQASSDRISIMASAYPARTYWFSGQASNNSNARVSSSIDYQLTPSPAKITASGGYNEGKWLGPGNPSWMTLNQRYSGVGVGLSLSVPLGFSVGPSSTERSWTSGQVSNQWYVSTGHEYFEMSGPVLGSISTTDGADICVGSYIYKARATCTKTPYQLQTGS
jgi:hypothetical protein